MDLTTTHIDYDLTYASRTRCRDLYDGLAAVKAKTKTYLLQHPNESDADYAMRLERAVLDPYIRKVITARQAVLWRRGATREVGNLVEYVEDVDLHGTHADIFFERVALNAQVDGIAWVVADYTRADIEPQTRADELRAGMRPMFQLVPGANVLDWDVGSDERLNWAVVSELAVAPRTQWGEAPEEVQRYRVWTRDEWFLYEDSGEGTQSEIDSGRHPVGEVPLVPFLGEGYSEYAGYPVCRDVAQHVVAIYNKWSDMDWFERLCNHPIPYIISPEKPSPVDAGKGLWVQAAQGISVAVGYLEPTGVAFDSSRESIRELQAKIYSLSLAQAYRDTKQVQSADSLREDRRIFTSSLEGVSRQYESREAQCWEYMGAWAGQTPSVEVVYDRDFDDSVIEATMLSALADIVDRGLLTRRSFLELLRRSDIWDGDVEDELNQIETEARDRAGSAATDALVRLRELERGEDNAEL
jgi:hypothetical protein